MTTSPVSSTVPSTSWRRFEDGTISSDLPETSDEADSNPSSSPDNSDSIAKEHMELYDLVYSIVNGGSCTKEKLSQLSKFDPFDVRDCLLHWEAVVEAIPVSPSNAKKEEKSNRKDDNKEEKDMHTVDVMQEETSEENVHVAEDESDVCEIRRIDVVNTSGEHWLIDTRRNLSQHEQDMCTSYACSLPVLFAGKAIPVYKPHKKAKAATSYPVHAYEFNDG